MICLLHHENSKFNEIYMFYLFFNIYCVEWFVIVLIILSAWWLKKCLWLKVTRSKIELLILYLLEKIFYIYSIYYSLIEFKYIVFSIV